MGSWRKVGAFLGLVPDDSHRDEYVDDYHDSETGDYPGDIRLTTPRATTRQTGTHPTGMTAVRMRLMPPPIPAAPSDPPTRTHR